MRALSVALLVIAPMVGAQSTQATHRYDVVIRGGRVMDPESGLDAIRNVGIVGDRVVRISSDSMSGRRVIDARGLVVAPGFIDLHQHAQDSAAYRVQALDGVTTTLELEHGVPDITRFLSERRGRSPINFGAAIAHRELHEAQFGPPPPGAVLPESIPATHQPATPEQRRRIVERLRAGLDAGALGIGLLLTETPGATHAEALDVFRLAAERNMLVTVQPRSRGRIEPGSSIEAIEELIAAAAITGAAVHIVHIHNSGLRDTRECIAMIESARSRGLDITTEAFPYGSIMGGLRNSLYDPGWRERLELDYGDLQLMPSGEHLTREMFDRLRAEVNVPRLFVFVPLNPDSIADAAMLHPLVMVASAGNPAAPQTAGTFARMFARYVRGQRAMTPMEALRKMTLMPAMRLERMTSTAKRKGRLQEGADADVVVFDLNTIEDRATFQEPMKPSVGVRYLLVAGTLVVDNGSIAPNVAPGRAVTAQRASP